LKQKKESMGERGVWREEAGVWVLGKGRGSIQEAEGRTLKKGRRHTWRVRERAV
jgi:hypothetical protein